MSLGNKEVMSKNLKHHMNKKGVDRNQLCSDLDLKYMTVSDWINAKTYPRIDKIELLANYFGINKSDLIEEKSTITTSIPLPNSLIEKISDKVVQLTEPNQKNVLRYSSELLDKQERELHEAPLVEYRIYEKLSAGTGTAIYDDHSYDLAYFDKELDHDIASWIYGDSMEPKYLNGDVALIKETGFDYDGAIYAVVWDGQTYIKKVYRENYGLRLVSLNNKYSDKIAPYDEDPRIIGKIVGSFTPVER
ncbi:XRE family transcriptional regulator [Streptococcus suis]|uniref:XRE family transcriptional regulator n=1 Tax=Streptococcus suis TaxID=1307 RepID=UPI001EF8DA2F|nr:XRE family transcriptional regulator [Streptococcus suis]MDG4503396.1 XRE family transcriptional regulator [Streptococcus suis]